MKVRTTQNKNINRDDALQMIEIKQNVIHFIRDGARSVRIGLGCFAGKRRRQLGEFGHQCFGLRQLDSQDFGFLAGDIAGKVLCLFMQS